MPRQALLLAPAGLDRLPTVPKVYLEITRPFGATHAGVGAYLLGRWGLPFQIVEDDGLPPQPAPPRPDLQRWSQLAREETQATA